MKLLLVSFCFLTGLTAASANGETSGSEAMLVHFSKDQLSEHFQGYSMPHTCSQTSKNCIGGNHEHARRCIDLFYDEKRTEIEACKATNQALVDLSREWQLLSFAWHKAIDDCLQGLRPPPRTENDDGDEDRFFRFKRHGSHGKKRKYNCTADEDHAHQYENARECWNEFKDHKKKCAYCVATDVGCKKYIACTGRGPEPPDANTAGWWAHVKKLTVDKKKKIKQAKREMFTCLGLSGK